MKLTKRHLLYGSIASSTVILFGGGLDFLNQLLTEARVAEHLAVSAFSPVAIMLLSLAGLGVYLLISGGKKLTVQPIEEKLGKKQVEAGFILAYFTMILLELVFRVTMTLP